MTRETVEDISIIRVNEKADLNTFIGLPYDIFAKDSVWRAPLRFERKEQIDPLKNPGLANIETAYFLAMRGDKPVGRCAGFINNVHLEHHQDETGHFGFLDTYQDDTEALNALMSAVENWLKIKGMKHCAGPFNFSVNEELGLLVDGFDTPPMVMMPHGRPDYAPSLEALGYGKEKDLLAYIANLDIKYSKLVKRILQHFKNNDSLSIKRIDMSDFATEIRTAMDIFNDAWSENWGFLPFNAEQVTHLAEAMKHVIDPDGFWFGYVDGKPVSFVIMLPNLNEALEGLNGHLLPFGWSKLLYRLKVKGVKTARIPLMGTRKALHKTHLAAPLMTALFEACFLAQAKKGVKVAELSWVLEDNRQIHSLIRLIEGKVYKTYRIYSKSL